VTTLELEQEDEKTSVCDCCGSTTHTVWGWVHEAGRWTRAAYLVRWAEEEGPHPPHVTLGWGGWGEGTGPEDRASIYAELRDDARFEFVDHPAPGALPGEEDVMGERLPRSVVEGDPRAGEVRETIEFLLRADDRLAPLVERR
jgi:hypothetical protein